MLGRAMLSRNIGLVYGGGGVGMMGRISETVKNGGGEIIGIIPNALLAREVGRGEIGELRIVRSMHERKAMMVEISDGFIALPGGFGTFEEFCEIVTWAQLGLHSKPVGLLNIDSYFDPLIEQFDRAVAEEFAYPENRRLILHETDPRPSFGPDGSLTSLQMSSSGSTRMKPEQPRLYSEFASWFHLLTLLPAMRRRRSSLRKTLSEASPAPLESVLELGSGGGNNAFHLKHHFKMTLTDLSSGMLGQSRAIESRMRAYPGGYAFVAVEPRVRRGVRS